MAFKFTCPNCKKTGLAACSKQLPFLHCSWYRDYEGLTHDCLYCRSCGAVHDTIGSFLGVIKTLFGRDPSEIVATYEISVLKRLTRINNHNFPGLRSINPYILSAIEEDGRLTEDEDLTEEPTIEFLSECLTDKNYIVRREAVIALKKFQDKRAVDLLVESLGDKHWDVRKNAEVILGDLKDSETTGPSDKPLEVEKWQYFGYRSSQSSFDKVRRRRSLSRLRQYLYKK